MKENGTILIRLSPPIPGFEQFINPYLIRGKRLALLDPGPKACLPELLSQLEKLNVKPEELDYILATHIHIDHIGGMGELMRHAVKAQAIVHPQGVKHLASPERLWQGSLSVLKKVAEVYGQIDPVPEARLTPAADGMEVDLGSRTLKVFFTPGHASHHLSLWDGATRELFIGETGGVYNPALDAIRPATPPPFDLEITLGSLAKVASLGAETICYAHGGPVSAARKTLSRFQSQLLRWKEIISANLGQEPEAILQILLEQDEELSRHRSLPGPQFEREKFFLSNAIAGFVGYLKR